jgi:hypothetical protein
MGNREGIISDLQQKYHDSQDFIIHQFEYYDQVIVLIYLESMIEDNKIRKDVIDPLLLCEKESKFILHLLSLPSCKKITSFEDLEALLIGGNILIFISDSVYSYNVIKVSNNQPLDATVEMDVLGPQKGLSEDLNTNVTLVRARYPANTVKIEHQTAGTLSKTPIAIMYDVNLVDEDALKKLKKRLSEVTNDMIQSAGQLQNSLLDKKFQLFPTMMVTERPDRIAYNLAQGKIVILINGTPFGLIAPAVFFDFIAAMDDLSHTYWVARLMLLLRYAGLLITLGLPALYIAITSYNPEILRSQLSLTIAGSRAAVPYPSFFEVIFMMLAVEMLVESSIRLPKAIGPTATTVGGLILGQAAQQAQLVSSIMIIITAFVAIANFTVPINAMSFALRCARYPLILLASLFGLVGLVAGIVMMICYLSDIRSFGKPYLRVTWGTSKHIEHIIQHRKGEKG